MNSQETFETAENAGKVTMDEIKENNTPREINMAQNELPGTQHNQILKLMKFQKEEFSKQLQQLKELVQLQQQLRGTDPLYDQMVSEILGQKSVSTTTGKLASLSADILGDLRDLFSLKDHIASSKEARELSSQVGATPSQVKRYFLQQRKRVRQLLLRASERGLTSFRAPQISGKENVDGNEQQISDMEKLLKKNAYRENDGGIAAKILDLMGSESSVAGRSRLLQMILQLREKTTLKRLAESKNCFRVLVQWLSRAMKEEQTTLIRVLLKVFIHLPVSPAMYSQLLIFSKVVKKVERYPAQGVSDIASAVLVEWNKVCDGKIVTQNNGLKDKAEKSGSGMTVIPFSGLLEVRRPGLAFARTVTAQTSIEESRKPLLAEAPWTQGTELMKLSKKHATKSRGSFQDRLKKKPKLQLMEKSRAGPESRFFDKVDGKVNRRFVSKPLCADDIIKAKLKEVQCNGATVARREEKLLKSFSEQQESLSLLATTEANENLADPVVASLAFEQGMKQVERSFVLENAIADNHGQARDGHPLESLMEGDFWDEKVESGVVMRTGVGWDTPPVAVFLEDEELIVATGEESEEVINQATRIQGVEEAIYKNSNSIPSSPLEPDDQEDYDDSLTPEIDAVVGNNVAAPNPVESIPTTGDKSSSAHDPQLLSLFLSNPELVKQLTNTPSVDHGARETVTAEALLTMIKHQSTPSASPQLLHSNVTASEAPAHHSVVASMQSFQGATTVGISHGQQSVIHESQPSFQFNQYSNPPPVQQPTSYWQPVDNSLHVVQSRQEHFVDQFDHPNPLTPWNQDHLQSNANQFSQQMNPGASNVMQSQAPNLLNGQGVLARPWQSQNFPVNYQSQGMQYSATTQEYGATGNLQFDNGIHPSVHSQPQSTLRINEPRQINPRQIFGPQQQYPGYFR